MNRYSEPVPSGRVHESINLTVFGAAALGYGYARARGYTAPFDPLLNEETLTLLTVSYFVGTFLVTPDLDLAENRVRAKDHWGVFGLLWVPYGEMFKHRGLSHTWIVGPLTRLLYLAAVALALSWGVSALAGYLGYTLCIRTEIREDWPEWAGGALVGYYLSQWLHLAADGIKPDHGFKRRRRKNS